MDHSCGTILLMCLSPASPTLSLQRFATVAMVAPGRLGAACKGLVWSGQLVRSISSRAADRALGSASSTDSHGFVVAKTPLSERYVGWAFRLRSHRCRLAPKAFNQLRRVPEWHTVVTRW